MQAKIIIGGVLLLGVIGGGTYYYMNTTNVQANPDYICTAQITNPVCEVSDYNNCTWSGGVGTCNGTRKISKTYSSVRIWCDIFQDSTVTSSKIVGDKGGESGLYGNITYTTEACQVTGVQAPTWASAVNTTTSSGITSGTTGTGYVESQEDSTTGSTN
jgi:hypothetical protein